MSMTGVSLSYPASYLFPQYNWPPSGPVTMTSAINSYQYAEYTDDDYTQAWFYSYNITAQNYLDTVNSLNLPNYIVQRGKLLDWIGAGIYGLPRPVITTKYATFRVGQLNSWEIPPFFGTAVLGTLNTMQLNYSYITPVGPAYPVDDDVYKRILTWHFYKGDGKYFSFRWLKRRIMRFLLGKNGTAPNIDNTYQISVTQGPNHEVTIRIVNSNIETLQSFELNSCVVPPLSSSVHWVLGTLNTTMLNYSRNEITPIPPLPNQKLFQQAVYNNVLELPLQYTWEVVIY